MNNLDQQLSAIEGKYLNRFYNSCKEMFSSCHIPSHNHTHHLRVWAYCKQLIKYAGSYGRLFSDDFIEGLLAAAMFHDVGLSQITDERHGPEGAELFKQYMAANPAIHLSLYKEAEQAIYVHDLKSPSSLSEAFDLASILTICDNLDAFGYIGAYRYVEIYLIRGVDISKVAPLSLNNIEKRFSSFELHYAQLPQFYEEQKQRYINACNVFLNDDCMAELIQAISQAIKERLDISENIEIFSKKSKLAFWCQLAEELSSFESIDVA